jgi:hypothetical protein
MSDDVSKVHWPKQEIGATGQRLGSVTPASGLPAGDLRDEVLAAGPRSDANIWPPTSGNAWPRRFLQRVMPIPEPTYRTCPDLYLCGLAPLYGTIARCDEPLSLWRVHESNNTWREAFAQRVDKYVALWDACCDDIEQHARRLGTAPDRAAWRARSWWHRLQHAVEQIRLAIPEGRSFMLIDDEQWGCGGIDDRRALVLSPPAHDAELLSAIEEHRRAGTDYLVIARDSEWWLGHYATFARSLAQQRAVHRSDTIDIYQLQDAHD